MRAAILFVVLVSACAIGSINAQADRKPKCKDCPANTYPCDEAVRVDKGNCYCSGCITKCSVRYNRCPAGTVCLELPSSFYPELKVAKCVPFEGCSNETCQNDCPVSDYLVDKNNCTTCLCNSPCLELCPPQLCFIWTTNTYLEPHYECMNKAEKTEAPEAVTGGQNVKQ